jgi:hypothetical protein
MVSATSFEAYWFETTVCISPMPIEMTATPSVIHAARLLGP